MMHGQSNIKLNKYYRIVARGTTKHTHAHTYKRIYIYIYIYINAGLYAYILEKIVLRQYVRGNSSGLA
jgi:hypothetical protein